MNTPTDHVALWMIGYEDTAEKSAEMQFMLSIYERPYLADGPELRNRPASYPKRFTIDYFRVYQPMHQTKYSAAVSQPGRFVQKTH